MTLDGLPLSFFDGAGVVAVVVLFGWFFIRAVMRGSLVTRREADAIGADRDAWRQVAQVQGKQLDKVLINSETEIEILRSIQQRGNELRGKQ